MSKILIVNPDYHVRHAYKQALMSKGYSDFLDAWDGLEGLNMANASVPSVIITENEMPSLYGWIMARALKADEKTKSIQIIGIGKFNPYTDRRFLDYHIEKDDPDALGKLSSALETILG